MPTPVFNIDSVIKESLSEEESFRKHLASVEAMTCSLNSAGWVLLNDAPTHEQVLAEYDSLSSPSSNSSNTAEQLELFHAGSPGEFSAGASNLSYHVVRFDVPSSDEATSSKSEFQVSIADPSLFQFFFDLYKLEGNTDLPFLDITVSFLNDEADGSTQQYAEYAGDDLADIENFLRTITASTTATLIFTGRFERGYVQGKKVLVNALADKQRSINAICVDVDGIGGQREAIDPAVLGVLLSRLPGKLKPSYISLSGNGFHLWYVFDSAIQLFSKKSPRRARFNQLARYLYEYIRSLLSDQPVDIDDRCRTLCHGFRAPGSSTKYGDKVRCFMPVERVGRRSRIDPRELANFLLNDEKSGYNENVFLEDRFVSYLGKKELGEMEKRRAEKEQLRALKPATEKQLLMLHDLEDKELMKPAEVADIASLSVREADELIKRLVCRSNAAKNNVCPERLSWTTKPHVLYSGKDGGVYGTVYSSIQKVALGRRYTALYMLAGVAYMMDRPEKSLEEVTRDFYALLKTDWAKQGNPERLTKHDVENALKGYNQENWRQKESIINALGFDPFKPAPPRNGRSQKEHLADIARPAYKKSSAKEKIARIVSYLEGRKSPTMADCARKTGISRPTVKKYWAKACVAAGVEENRIGNYCPY